MRNSKYRTEVSETSINSFREELRSGNHAKKKQKALKIFESNPKAKITALELSKLTGISYTTTTSLCNEFYHDNKIVLVGKKINISTGRKAKAYTYNSNNYFLNRVEKLKKAREKIERGKRKIQAGLKMFSEGVQDFIKLKKHHN